MQTYLATPVRGRWHLLCEETGGVLMEFDTKEQVFKQCAYLLRNISGTLKVLNREGVVEEVLQYPGNRAAEGPGTATVQSAYGKAATALHRS